MDKKALSFLCVGVILGALVSAGVFSFALNRSATGSVSASERRVLKLGHVLESSHPVHVAMEHLATRLSEISGGAMEIEIFPNGQLGSEAQQIEQVQNGGLDMVKTSTAALEQFVPQLAVFGLPYLFRDNAHFWTVLNGPIGRQLLAAGESRGMHGLCYYDSGSRSFYTSGDPIRGPADVRGKKIRVVQSPMAMDMISNFGGAPTPIPWGEVYTALQQGMVDGAENNPPSFLSSRQYEVAKHYTLDEHTSVPDMVIMSASSWASLTSQQRLWLDQAAEESVVFQRRLWEERTAAALEELQQNGVTVLRPDKAAFMAAAAPLYEAIAGTPVGELADRIREAR
jgi:tripartite ATP-independent transporter DctP family solute receptor